MQDWIRSVSSDDDDSDSDSIRKHKRMPESEREKELGRFKKGKKSSANDRTIIV